MRTSTKWLLLGGVILGAVVSAETAHATPPERFNGTPLAQGRFEEFNVRSQYPLPGFGGSETDLWFSLLKTKGDSDLYVFSNRWEVGGTTGWHTHPGASLIIVTHGTITAYDGDDPTCTKHVFTASSSENALIDANHVHMIRNETNDYATAIAVQLVPAGVGRRINADPGFNCP